jgi:hypothetical protein
MPTIDVITVEAYDAQGDALGIKGVNEIGTTGSAGAVAHASVARHRRPRSQPPDPDRGPADAPAIVAANDVAAWRGSTVSGRSTARHPWPAGGTT